MYLGLKGLRTVYLSLGKESPYIVSKFNCLIWTPVNMNTFYGPPQCPY